MHLEPVLASVSMRKPISRPLEEGKDYELDNQGRFVLSKSFLLEQGECCDSDCLNCPYKERPQNESDQSGSLLD